MQPAGMVLETEAGKVRAEGLHGNFTLLPRHVDVTAALTAGIVEVVDLQGREIFLAVNGGLLVKVGGQVLIASPQAVENPDLAALRRTVEEDFQRLDDQERKARGAMARLEAGMVRKFLEL